MSEFKEFKVDDYVVNTNGAYDHIDVVANVELDGYFTTRSGMFCNPKVHRLAEPEEIAAGHRIDCETLDKPENHISPNCEVRDA